MEFDDRPHGALNNPMVEITILGCAGGLSQTRKTTALRVGRPVLIDAGSGLAALSQADLCEIDHVFLTHAHLDHISALPLLMDAVRLSRKTPITVHCLPETEQALRHHILNNSIWPDLTRAFQADMPILIKFSPVAIGTPVALDAYRITPHPARHPVAAIGYSIADTHSEIMMTGDSAPCPEFWTELAKHTACHHVIADISFPDEHQDVAFNSGHMTPSLLKKIMTHSECHPHIYVTHMKPGFEKAIIADLARQFSRRAFTILEDGMRIATN